jgi:CheY-like chemotaxis protein
MGGSIGLDSEAGQGTTAGFTIPFKKPRCRFSNFEIDLIPERLQSDMSVSCRSSDNGNGTPPDSPPDTNMSGSDFSRSHSLLKRLGRTSLLGVDSDLLSNFEERKKRHVLVVEDNEINQQIAIRLIKKLNFTVSAVKNGIEALDFVQKCTELPATTDNSSNLPTARRRPDVILMDVQMPELDGYSATRAIRSGKLSHTDLAPRSHPSTSMRALSPPTLRPTSPRETIRARNVQDWLISVPIVAMTASAIKGDKEKCREAGMDDYLAKPVRGGMLEKMLVKWCSSAVSSSRTNSAAGDDPVSLDDDGRSLPALSAIAGSSVPPIPALPRTQNGSSAMGTSTRAGPPDQNGRKIKEGGVLIDAHGQVGRDGLEDVEEIIRNQDRSVLLIQNDTQDRSDGAERAENKLGSGSPPMLTANEGNSQQQQETKEDQKETPTYPGNV